MNLQSKITDLRKRSGLSQEEMAEKLNVSRQTISRWEVGSAQPDAENLRQLSQLFGVTADYLLNDAYDSDADLPRVKRAEETLEKTVESSQKLFLIAAIAFIAAAVSFLIAGIDQQSIGLIVLATADAALSGIFLYRYKKSKKSPGE